MQHVENARASPTWTRLSDSLRSTSAYSRRLSHRNKCKLCVGGLRPRRLSRWQGSSSVVKRPASSEFPAFSPPFGRVYYGIEIHLNQVIPHLELSGGRNSHFNIQHDTFFLSALWRAVCVCVAFRAAYPTGEISSWLFSYSSVTAVLQCTKKCSYLQDCSPAGVSPGLSTPCNSKH